MLSELLLQSGSDIVFPEAKVFIHQPKIKEISYVTEENFYAGCGTLNFSKDKLMLDKGVLDNLSDFKIFMSIVNTEEFSSSNEKKNMMAVLVLMFPEYKINITPFGLILIDSQTNNAHAINEENFEEFKAILREMFCLNFSTAETQDYNPKGARSKSIAEKLKKGRAKKAALNGEGPRKISILSRYISILSVGLQKDKNDLLNYTIPQLMDEFNRYQLKTENDIYIQAKMAGAKDIKEVDPWMKDMYESK